MDECIDGGMEPCMYVLVCKCAHMPHQASGCEIGRMGVGGRCFFCLNACVPASTYMSARASAQ